LRRQLESIRLIRLPSSEKRAIDRFVNVGHAEVQSRAAELVEAGQFANVGVPDDQMRGLIFFVTGSVVVLVGELIERELAVYLGGAVKDARSSPQDEIVAILFHDARRMGCPTDL